MEWCGEQGGRCLENTKTRYSKAEGTGDGKTEIKRNPTKRKEMKDIGDCLQEASLYS
jgi:hypothetical protein